MQQSQSYSVIFFKHIGIIYTANEIVVFIARVTISRNLLLPSMEQLPTYIKKQDYYSDRIQYSSFLSLDILIEVKATQISGV